MGSLSPLTHPAASYVLLLSQLYHSWHYSTQHTLSLAMYTCDLHIYSTYIFCTCMFFSFFKEYTHRIAFIRLYLLLRTSHNLAFLSLEWFSCFWPWETAQILLKASVNISDLLAETSQPVFHLYRSSQTFFHMVYMCPSSFFAVIIEKNYSLKCYSAVLIKQKSSDFINKLNLKVVSAVYFFLYSFLLLYVINILSYSHVWHTWKSFSLEYFELPRGWNQRNHFWMQF